MTLPDNNGSVCSHRRHPAASARPTLLLLLLRLSVKHVHEELSGNQWDIFFPPPASLIVRVHKINDGTHHGAICAHMGPLAF